MEKILEHLKDNHENSVEELMEYIRFPSISAQPNKHGKDIDDCANWIESHCKNMGLEVEKYPTSGNPIIIAKVPNDLVEDGQNAKKILLYGHYDVQPPEPFDLWTTPPFEPTIRNGNIYARGASDNKGQHFSHLKAIEAYLKTGSKFPCHITMVIEGEEEVGSESLYKFIEDQPELLSADFLYISDNGIPSLEHPTITYALRGVCALDVELNGPNKDLHSGFYGGAIANPATELCRLLSKIHNEDGVVQIPGFYECVTNLTDEERESFKQLPESDQKLLDLTGAPDLKGELDYSSYERRSCRPTVEINGMISGYNGDGSKTIIPAKASAKLTMRLVPNQDPKIILDLVENFLKSNCPPSVQITVEKGHAGAPYLTSPNGPFALAASSAVEKAFGKKALISREGGSIPIINEFKEKLGIETLLPGLGLPDDNMHSPNEKFTLECFERGKLMSAYLIDEIGALAK